MKKKLLHGTAYGFLFAAVMALSALMCGAPVQAQTCAPVASNPITAQTCAPVASNPINVDGIVVGTAVAGGSALPAGCSVDPGWQGVVSQDFSVFGEPGTHEARIFMTGYNPGGGANIDKIYLGVHVEGDPELTSRDILVLYFDANGNDSWDGGDFAVMYEVGSSTPPSNEVCGRLPFTSQFFRYNSVSGLWVQQPIFPAYIHSNVSWDYDAANDGENEIWELETEIDNANGEVLRAPTSGKGFKVGAKLYIQENGAAGTTVWRWPVGLTDENNPDLYDPNEGCVIPANMEVASFQNCYDVVFWPDSISGVTATDNEGNSNAFTRLDINSTSDFDASGNALKQNHFTARLKFVNRSDLDDASSVTGTNQGNVKFWIKPYNAGVLSENLMGAVTKGFDHIGQIRTVQLDWPWTKAQYSPLSANFQDSGHSCLKVALEGFNVNMNEPEDVVNRNLTYISTSTVRDTFVVSNFTKIPKEYILRAKWRNLGAGKISAADRTIQLAGLVSTGGVPVKDGTGFVFIPVRRGSSEWKLRFENSAALGLYDMGNGYFSMTLKPMETKKIKVAITGGRMPVAPGKYVLSPRAGGSILNPASGEPPLEMKVTPGKMVTIVAHGLINVNPGDKRKRSNGPNGFSLANFSNSNFLLPGNYYDPSQNIGAVIGSFDNFKTAFVVGADMTFLVPEKAEKLYLAVNDVVGGYGDNTGKGFEINLIMTDPLYLPTRLAAPGNAKAGIPAQPRAGSNLPELDISVFEVKQLGDNDKSRLLKPTGYVAYAVYDSHVGVLDGPVCGRAKVASYALSSLFALIGIVVIRRRVVRKKSGKQ